MSTIDIYTTPHCGFCKQVKAMLKERSILYTEHDVTASEDALNEMKGISHGALSVPVVVADKGTPQQKYAIGFEEAKKLLGEQTEEKSKKQGDTALLTCPECDHKQEGTIPTTSCVPFYACDGCKKTIRAAGEDCCVFCSYADKPCPISNKKKGGCADGSCSV